MRATRQVLCALAVLATGLALAAPGASATAQPVMDRGPFATPGGFVNVQFDDFLDRPASGAEDAAWIAKVVSGQSAASVVDGIRNLDRGANQFAPVARLYSAYLLRTPDVGGLNYWLGTYRKGRSLSSISSSFAGSKEFKNRYGSLTNKNFVLLIYKNVLQRKPDTTGVNYWTKKLDAGTSRGQVMLNFSESSEYKRKTSASIDALHAYVAMLRRSPNTTENGTAIALVTSAGFQALAQKVLKSDEYRLRFGITSTLVPMPGATYDRAPLGRTVVDASGTYAYSTNRALNEVEVTDIAAKTVVASIGVGSSPYGIDFSVDGTKLYVANAGGSDVSVIDVATRKELRRITIPAEQYYSNRPRTIAVADNGSALLATTGDDYGSARMLQLDLKTETVTATGTGVDAILTDHTPMQASGDRSKIYIASGAQSGGDVYVYDAATRKTITKKYNDYVDGVAVNQDGSVAVFDRLYVTDPTLTIQGMIPSAASYESIDVALTPSGAAGYSTESNSSGASGFPARIRYLDVAHFRPGSSLGLSDAVTTYLGSGLVVLVPGKDLAVVQTDTGLTITPLPTYA